MAARDQIMIAFFIASVPVCFFRPFYGICMWIVVAFLNPHSFTWASHSHVFPWAEAMAIPTLLGFLVFSRDLKGIFSRECFLIVVLMAWFTFTSLMSTHTPFFLDHAQDTWDKYQLVSKVLVMTLAMPLIVNTFPRLRIFVLVIAGCFAVFVVKAVPFLISSGGSFRLYGPENSMIADNNDFGLALDMTAPIFFFLSTLESNKWLKRAFAALFLFTIPCVFFTYSRGALVGLMVIVTLMLLRLKQRVWLFPAIAVGVAVAVMFAPEAWKARMDPTSNEVIDASAMSRFNAWHFSWNLASDYPLTGGGFSTYTPRLFSEYALNALDVHGAHSIYFGVLGEHGFPGLALYLALVLSCFMTTSRLIRDARFFGDERVVLYANMFRFSILGFLTAGAFLGRSYFDYYFAVVACIVALNRAARQEWAAMEQASEEDELEEENDVLPVTGGQILEGV